MKTIPQDKVLFGGYTKDELNKEYLITQQQSIIRNAEERLPRIQWYYKNGTPSLYEKELNELEDTIKLAKAKLILLGVNPND